LDAGFRTADLVPANGDETSIRRVGTTGMTAAIVDRIATPEAAREPAAVRT
jgi:hypothetical protein